jgi:hypothetical protein
MAVMAAVMEALVGLYLRMLSAGTAARAGA